MHRNIRAAVAALALVLAVAPAAMAATISESVTVNSVLTVTGIPASISYGTLDPGTTSGVQSFTASVTANSGYTYRVSGSDFTGPGTIGKVNRESKLALASGSTIASGLDNWTNFANSAYDGSNVVVTGNAGSSSFLTELRLTIPGATAPGSYSGSITYTFTAN